MRNQYLAIGDSLGVYNVQNETKYRIKLHDIYEVTKELFFVWDTIRKSEANFQRLLQALDEQEQKDITDALQSLVEIGLIVDLKTLPLPDLVKNYSMFPKGHVVKKTEIGYEILLLRKHKSIDVPIIPYLVWEHAHPFVELVDIIEIVKEHTGAEEEKIYEQLQAWLPILISTGLATLKPLR